MPFNSLTYFLFLPVIYLIHHLVGERARWCVLLAASLLFYGALRVPYLLGVLGLVAVATYACGILIDRAASHTARTLLLWGGVALNVLILAWMKYLPFLWEQLSVLAALPGLELHAVEVQPLVAIGVSYYVFQALSYLFDIYHELEKPERHFGYFALYLSFFPKLLQGPIERAGDLIPQFKAAYRPDYHHVRSGLLLLAWGLFKKIVIADGLAVQVDAVYGEVQAHAGWPLLLATYAYAFQIYMDFSGYTDMALGSARLFGINLTRNFDSPYLATSVADFWRRWHITFSRWILDYVFRPLQMRWRNGKNFGTAAALVVAFLVSGIWHGDNWRFVIWGGLHGLYMACSVFYRPYQKKLHKALGIDKTRVQKVWMALVTFNLVCFAWIFFRAETLEDAWYVVTHLFAFHRVLPALTPDLAVLALLTSIPAAVSFLEKRRSLFEQPAWVRWGAYYALGVAIATLNQSSQGFIYFRF